MKNINWSNKELEQIESPPKFHKLEIGKINFTDIQHEVINLVKTYPDLVTSNDNLDYGKLYLLMMENRGIIKILKLPNVKILSPESPDRILRLLKEYSRNGNPDLKFLLKYDKDLNVNLDIESKEYYRNN